MRKIILLSIIIAHVPLYVLAQTVTNVVAKQVGNTVEISYDLDMPAYVSLQFSRDGGKTYEQQGEISLISSRPSNSANFFSAISGDIGQTTSGHKQITWNLFKDGVDWDVQQAVFKVIAQKLLNITFTVNGISFDMIYVEGGSFTMGAYTQKEWWSRDYPSHRVSLNDYYIAETEVTQSLWRTIMGDNPSHFKGDNNPVEQVSWNECQKFIDKLNILLSTQLGSMHFCLPTEAQWEYAARGGTKTRNYTYSGSNNVSSVAWYAETSGGFSSGAPHPVKSKKSNELGIYDMSGNVWEFCSDWFGSYSDKTEVNPTGPSEGPGHVKRGGGWGNDAESCIITERVGASGDDGGAMQGLRIALIYK